MNIQMDLISGINVGVEYIENDVYGRGGIFISLFVIRFLITWG